MSKKCDWCGGVIGKEYVECYQSKHFCCPNHRAYWSRKGLMDGLTEEELATRDSNLEVEVVPETTKRVMTTSSSLSRGKNVNKN